MRLPSSRHAKFTRKTSPCVGLAHGFDEMPLACACVRLPAPLTSLGRPFVSVHIGVFVCNRNKQFFALCNKHYCLLSFVGSTLAVLALLCFPARGHEYGAPIAVVPALDGRCRSRFAAIIANYPPPPKDIQAVPTFSAILLLLLQCKCP